MRKIFTASFFITALFFLTASGVAAQAKQRVRFARGETSTKIQGTVRGYAYRDYIVRASAGQTISTKLSSRNTFAVLTIFKPDGDNLEGATEMDEFTGELPASGEYVIRVGMMRAEARRKNSVAVYSLQISIR